ncbi:Ribosomal protein L35 [Fasciola gigantica]|uniref:Large ribosomal subunit protein uL29 n=1 Tax=Fasciola gigantica TaxID=46835 RepID=A0A504YDP7_FASGI|nr:Ribosomal protein L35 [Fasciola gigantica]
MTKIKASKLRGKPEPELQKQLVDLKTELGSLRLYRVTRGTAYHGKLKKIRVLRKSIARVYTVMHQAQKERQREAYRSKKYVPKDLRPKKTRAIRRRLTRKERSIHTERSLHMRRAFPMRLFAVKR